MPVELYKAPPGTGKTHWAVEQALQESRNLVMRPVVCVENALQRREWQRRIAKQGGAIGVQVLTFQGLARLCLSRSGQSPDVLDDNLQYRLLRSLLVNLELSYYSAIQAQPGFAVELTRLLNELEHAMITPAELDAAAHSLDLAGVCELALIYDTYIHELARLDKIDSAGLAWQAIKSLSETNTRTICDLLIIDGLSDYTVVQACLLQELAPRVGRMIVLLDCEPADATSDRIGSPLTEDLALISEKLGTWPVFLPQDFYANPLGAISTNLFSGNQVSPIAELELLAAPNTEHEIREALRWLKARIMLDGVAPEDTALVMRSLGDRIPMIEQLAQEFELPVRIEQGQPLGQNPCIAIMLMLLEALSPLVNEPMALPPRELIEVLASPYMDFQHAIGADGAPLGWLLQDTHQLDRIARDGVVIQGLTQWREALDMASQGETRENTASFDDDLDDTQRPPFTNARQISERFERMVERLAPPVMASYRDWVGWFENLIGDEAETPMEQNSLGIARLIVQDPLRASRDRGALLALKDILRALVEAEATLGAELLGYPAFLDELRAATRAATYLPETRGYEPAVQVLSAPRCQGLSFSAVALVGLAEGEFPQTLRDDILLPEAVRHKLRLQGLPLRQPLRSMEQALLYKVTACARDKLLCTRPRLTADGAEWAPSPYWEELASLCATSPTQLTSSSLTAWESCASWDEVVLAASRGRIEWQNQELEQKLDHVNASVSILHSRTAGYQGDECDGYLADLAETLQQRFNAETVWSPTRLERYTACPFWFFVNDVLRLEPREEPRLGPDARQLGSLLHRILEKTYRAALEQDDVSTENLLNYLDTVCEEELVAAPYTEGFRETAWWEQTRQQLREALERTIRTIEQDEGWHAERLEAYFAGQKPVSVEVNGETLQLYLRGVIDRVDRDEQGHVRIIDYKTGGASSYTNKRVEDGELLQMPLYALAAEQIFELGKVRDGFYWHILAAQASALNLADYDTKHAEPASVTAMCNAWKAIEGIMAGQFVPSPPSKGCPSYCPAAGFCSHYRGGWGQ